MAPFEKIKSGKLRIEISSAAEEKHETKKEENKDDEKGETFLVIPLDKGQITIRVFFETRYEDTTVRESSKDRYKTVSRGLTEDELQDLIAMIDIGSMGRQTQDVLEDNIKYAENYTSIIQETVPDARNDVQKLDTTLQEATPEIKELVEKYYRGEQDGDPDMIRQTSMYPEVVVDKCVLRDAEYYENIRVDDIYMVPAANDGEWMLFVRYEIKYKDMDPVLPYISTFYVFTDEDGSLKQIILSSPMRMYFEQDQYVRGILGTLMAANEAYPEVVEMREECSEAFEKARDDDPEFDEFMTFWKTRTSFLDELWGTRD